MANYLPSVLLKAQAKIDASMQAPEFRYKMTPAFEVAKQNSNFLIPNYEALKTSDSRAVETYIINRSSRSAGSARAYDHSGVNGDTTAVSLTWATYTDKFKLSLKQGDRNIFDNAELLAKQYMNAFINIHNAIGTAAQDYLSTNKNQVELTSPKGATWNDTNNAYVISAADSNRFAQRVKSIMRQDNYNTNTFDVIADPTQYADLEYIANQGTGNSTNWGFQYNGLNIAESTEITVPDNFTGAAFVMPAGTFGVLPWIPKKNREGWGDMESYVGGYGTIVDPISGLTMAVHGYAERADNDTTGSEVQDVNYEFEVSIDLAFLSAPLSTSDASVINLFLQGA